MTIPNDDADLPGLISESEEEYSDSEEENDLLHNIIEENLWDQPSFEMKIRQQQGADPLKTYTNKIQSSQNIKTSDTGKGDQYTVETTKLCRCVCECTDECSRNCPGCVSAPSNLIYKEEDLKNKPKGSTVIDNTWKAEPDKVKEQLIGKEIEGVDKPQVLAEEFPHHYKCGVEACTIALSFRGNLITHCELEHDCIDTTRINDWLDRGDNLASHGNKPKETPNELCLLTSTNKICKEKYSQTLEGDILDQVETRYHFPGNTDTVQGIHYMNSLKQETFRPFTKNFRVTRLVMRACIAFLKFIKKKLSLTKQFHKHFKYLTIDPKEDYLAYGELKDHTTAKQNHEEKKCNMYQLTGRRRSENYEY